MPTSYDDEALVAYLDGELPPAEASAIEVRLNEDPSLQSRLNSLKQTWELLSVLPEVAPKPDLAQSTIELVAVQLEKQQNAWWRKLLRNPWAILATGCLAAYLIGLGLGQVLAATLTDRLLSILPTVADYDSLQAVDSEAWLEELASMPNLTTAFPSTGIGDGIVPEKIRDRSNWVNSLDEVDRGILEDNLTDFRQENDPRREELQRIAKSIYRSEDKRQLLDQVRSYKTLLNERSTLQAASIKGLSLQVRAARVRYLVNSKMLTLYAIDMPLEDQVAIQDWVDQQEFFYPWVEFTESTFLEDGNIGDATITELVEALSENAQTLLKPLNEDRKRLTLGLWVMSILNPDKSINATPQQLLETLEKLAEREELVPEQERIQLLPEDEARSELKRIDGFPSDLEESEE